MSRPRLLPGRDYYCGWCAGHGVVPCDYCVEGSAPGGYRCPVCRTRDGRVQCPECEGDPVRVPAPDWLPAPDTPRPPVSSRGDWRETECRGPGEADA